MHAHSEENGEEVPFFPNVLLAEVSLAIAVIGLLAVFVSLFPLKLGEKFDPLHPPSLLEPEWYFMGIYQVLKTQGVQPVDAVVLMAALGIFLVLIPFIDGGSERRPLRRPVFTAVGLLAITEFLGLTTFGFLSPGQVGSFSSIRFTVAFALTNAVALALVALVFVLGRKFGGRAQH